MMKDAAAEKDSPEIQKERIERIVSGMSAVFRIEFYRNRVNPKTTDIRFKIYETSTNKIVCLIKQDREWASSKVADMSDSELRRQIVELTNASSDGRCDGRCGTKPPKWMSRVRREGRLSLI